MLPKIVRSDDAAAEGVMGEARRVHRLPAAAASQRRAGTDHMRYVANFEAHIHLNVEMGASRDSRRFLTRVLHFTVLLFSPKNRAGL